MRFWPRSENSDARLASASRDQNDRDMQRESLIKTGVLVWDRSGLGEELRSEWLSCQGVVDAQLDAYAGGGGGWATGADDDDDYEDECVAETWRDGGVLSEADA